MSNSEEFAEIDVLCRKELDSRCQRWVDGVMAVIRWGDDVMAVIRECKPSIDSLTRNNPMSQNNLTEQNELQFAQQVILALTDELRKTQRELAAALAASKAEIQNLNDEIVAGRLG